MAKLRVAVETGAASQRPSRGRPPLPLDRILATALQIVDDEGADALTMRRLAGSLNTGTATLYRHFRSRTDLIGQVTDLLFGEMTVDFDERTNWRDACRQLAEHMFAVLARHRGAARLLVEFVPSGPRAMIQRERALANFLANGFPAPLAARAYATLARYVLGFAIQLSDGVSGDDPHGNQLSELGRLDKLAFPATFALTAFLPVPLEDEFSFGLGLMIDGLDALL